MNFIYSSCMERDVTRRITLVDILRHPWMRRHASVVQENSPMAARFAVTQMIFLHNPVRPGPATAQMGPWVDETHYRAPSVGSRHYQANNHVQVPAASVPVQACPPHPINQSREDLQRLNQMIRERSEGSYASSGYYTRSNSLCLEDDRRRALGQGPSSSDMEALAEAAQRDWRDKSATSSESSSEGGSTSEGCSSAGTSADNRVSVPSSYTYDYPNRHHPIGCTPPEASEIPFDDPEALFERISIESQKPSERPDESQ